MSTTPNVTGYTTAASSGQVNAPTQTASQLNTEFLTLLMAQLQNQDPTNPVDDTQMLSQQAQISSLQQMQSLNSNFVAMMAMQNVAQATNMIGHTVTGTDASSGATVSGKVTGISFSTGTPVLNVTTSTGSVSTVDLSTVTQVTM
jgi:flagellar basal-body rod modification protein FlgD